MTERNPAYEYLHVVQGNFGFGWEDLTQSENVNEALTDLKAYRDNDPGRVYRKIQRREKKA